MTAPTQPHTTALRPSTLEEVRALFGAAPTREHVSLSPTKTPVEWFTIVDGEGETVGCCALMPVTPSRARLKGLWVRPDRRGEGHGTRATEERLEVARQRGFTECDQFAIRPAHHLARGWHSLSDPRGNGAQHLWRAL